MFGILSWVKPAWFKLLRQFFLNSVQVGQYNSNFRPAKHLLCRNNVCLGSWSSVYPGTSSASCLNCVAGTWASIRGTNSSAACVNCNAGTYASLSGATSNTGCTACGVGKWSKAGAATCRDCLFGRTVQSCFDAILIFTLGSSCNHTKMGKAIMSRNPLLPPFL